MNKLFVYILILGLFSCEKLCTVTTAFCKGKVENQEPIDFTQIDLFPTFKTCESTLNYNESKTCFETTLNTKIGAKINRLQLSSENYLTDTVFINFSISNKGVFKCEHIKINKELSTSLPYLKDDIQEIINNLTNVAPAQKRGIPITSTFTIPLVIETE